MIFDIPQDIVDLAEKIKPYLKPDAYLVDDAPEEIKIAYDEF